MDHPDSTEEIPTLDISPYLQGEPGGCEAVAARLRAISMTVGFFYLKGHGVPRTLLARMFTEAKLPLPFRGREKEDIAKGGPANLVNNATLTRSDVIKFSN